MINHDASPAPMVEGSEARRPLRDATETLAQRTYKELRALAGALFRSQPDGHTLQPTALVHEAFLKLARAANSEWSGREHFLAVAARAMRQVLASHARKRRTDKRGWGRTRVTLTGIAASDLATSVDLVELDAVLSELEKLSPRQAQIVECRIFGGLTFPEIAVALEVSLATVEKDWRRARAWLAAELLP